MLQEVRQYAAFAIVKISQNSNVRKQVTEEGGLEPVLYLARTDEPEIQREIIPALCCLSFSLQNKIDICKFGGLPPIINALRDPNQVPTEHVRGSKVCEYGVVVLMRSLTRWGALKNRALPLS